MRTSDGDDARCIGVYFSLFVGDVHCSQVRLIFSRCQLPSDLEGQMLDLVGQSLQDLMPKYISMPLVCHPFAIRTRGGITSLGWPHFIKRGCGAATTLINVNNMDSAYNRERFVEKTTSKPGEIRPGLLLRQLPCWVFHLTRSKARAVLTGICVTSAIIVGLKVVSSRRR